MTETEPEANNGKAKPSKKRWLKKLAVVASILLMLPVLAIILLSMVFFRFYLVDHHAIGAKPRAKSFYRWTDAESAYQ